MTLQTAKTKATKAAWNNMTVHNGVRVEYNGQIWVRRARQGFGTITLGKWEQVG
jgi:hypothetical protein